MMVVSEFSDEGFSGKNIKGRPEFSRMMEKIESGEDNVDYVLVFKLSRFGRNAADVLNSLQIMQDYGINLTCVEDGIDSSKDAGKLMISVLAAVAEIKRENIRTQTMAGREQKAKEGKWNGGFAPYGYKLESGNLLIAEDEVEAIRIIGKSFVVKEYEDVIHIAGEFPDEFTESQYTKKLRGGLAKAKANSGQVIGEMIENAQSRRWVENKDEKHNKEASGGWYRYDVSFTIPVDDAGAAHRNTY